MSRLSNVCARLAVAALMMIAVQAPAGAAGALAVGKCGAYGSAIDFGAMPAARSNAMRKCEGKCQVVASVRKSCAALAVDGRNACRAQGWAAGKSLGRTQNEALRHCYRFGGRDCVIRAFLCDATG